MVNLKVIAAGVAAGAVGGLVAYGMFRAVANAPDEGTSIGTYQAPDGNVSHVRLGDQVGKWRYTELDDALAAARRLPGDHVVVQEGVSIVNREQNFIYEVDARSAQRLLSEQVTSIGSKLGTMHVVGVFAGDRYQPLHDRNDISEGGRLIKNEWY